ncbi:MAG: hypothetical protein JXB39_09640 [Deltaproteobacteria bacterium]|nr:hypothetical protein [Deltaproteobacteria bacterium]
MPTGPSICILLAALSALAGREEAPANSDPAVVAAEHHRLSDELQRLVERQIWVGAEHKFRACEALAVALEFRDLLNGAYAARGLGDAAASYERLRKAAVLEASKEVVDWLWALDTLYGKVVLSTNPPKGVELRAEALPFAPDQRAAVEFAATRLRNEGRFEGLLPSGSYVLGDIPFQVVPGVAIQIEAATKRLRTREPRPQEPPPPTPDRNGQL